jgi:hypothetical protein
MTLDDLPALIDVQKAGAVLGMAAAFPQDRYPFPRETVLARWREEIADAGIATLGRWGPRGPSW